MGLIDHTSLRSLRSFYYLALGSIKLLIVFAIFVALELELLRGRGISLCLGMDGPSPYFVGTIWFSLVPGF
jgi:predicted membrane channel-forming protein YqfA (hemolysin III family)